MLPYSRLYFQVFHDPFELTFSVEPGLGHHHVCLAAPKVMAFPEGMEYHLSSRLERIQRYMVGNVNPLIPIAWSLTK